MEVESLEYTEEKAIDDGRSIIFDILAIDYSIKSNRRSIRRIKETWLARWYNRKIESRSTTKGTTRSTRRKDKAN